LLKKLSEVQVSPRHVNNLTTMIGQELAETNRRQTEAYRAQPLPRQVTDPDTPIALATVACDGGRMQTRLAGVGSGVHQPHWRETKNAGFFRMKTRSQDADPHPALPHCFADRGHMSQLLEGVPEGDDPTAALSPPDVSSLDWRPKVLFRTCLSSLCDSDTFGPMMAAEADTRGLFAAERRAFLGDGQAYNWTIQKKHFPTFEPIVDFIHPLEYLYQAARAIHPEGSVAWETFQKWAEFTWQGSVQEVLRSLRDALAQLPTQEEDRHETVISTLTYLENNRSRMDYPRYRRQGLPVSSALIESLIKEINYRVKGSEKFWNDDPQGEAILYVRAALLCHDDRLSRHLRQRLGSPYARSRSPAPSTAA
jgi:hypothetical protein